MVGVPADARLTFQYERVSPMTIRWSRAAWGAIHQPSKSVC